MKRVLLGAVAVLAIFGTALPANADLFGFSCITNNIAGDCDIGEAQIFVDVTSAGADNILFTFTNNVGAASSVTDIYFDDGTTALLNLGVTPVITDSGAGVDFAAGAAPPDLPGGNIISFTADYSADSNPPTAANGVDTASEFVAFNFDLVGAGLGLNDVLAELASGDLRIGIHVQAFATDGSESFVNDTTPIPEPASLLLVGSGLVGFGVWGRKRLLRRRER